MSLGHTKSEPGAVAIWSIRRLNRSFLHLEPELVVADFVEHLEDDPVATASDYDFVYQNLAVF